MKAKIIVLDDLTFDMQYFHSVNLRVQMPPGMDEPHLCMVILTFITGGMKEYGLMNLDPSKTIASYSELLKKLGRKGLTPAAAQSMLKDKLEEIEMVKKMREEKKLRSPMQPQPPGPEALALLHERLGPAAPAPGSPPGPAKP